MNKEHNCLNALKTSCISKESTLFILKQNRLLNTAICLEQVSPEMIKQENLSMLHLWRHLHNKYTTVPKIYKRFSNLS
jgi:hypothetical protein